MKAWIGKLTILSVFVLGSSSAMATLRLGIDGALSMATLSTNTTVNYTSRTGFMAGGLVEVGFNDFFSLQLEANYVQRGAKVLLTAGAATPINTLQYDYIAVPLYLKLAADFPVVRPFVAVGPYLGFNISAQSVPYSAPGSTTTTIATPITNAPSIDFGASGMIGAEFSLTPAVGLFVDLRYDWGFTDLDPSLINNYNTRTLLIGAGILVGF